MSVLRELWSVLTPSQRRSVLAAQAVSLAMAVSTVAGIAAIAPFFAVLGDPRLIEASPQLRWAYVRGGFTSESSFVLALGAAFIVLVLSANLLNVLGLLALSRVVVRIGNAFKTTLFEAYLSRSYLFHLRTRGADLFDRIVHESTRVSEGILQSGFVLCTNAVTGALIVASVVLVSPAVAAALLLGLGGGYLALYLLVSRRLLRIGYAHSRAWTGQARLVGESLGAVREIILLADREPLCKQFARASRRVAESAAHVRVVGQIPRHIMECLAVGAAVLAALVLGAKGGAHGAAPRGGAWLGELTFIAFAAYRLLPILQQIFSSGVRIRADGAALARIAQDLRQARAVRGGQRVRQGAATDRSWSARPREAIRLCRVSFRYSAAEPWALDDVSLDIPARSLTGIAGANGSGKTTLLDVLAGLLPPERGELWIDELRLDDGAGLGGRTAWQDRIAYVPQQVFLLDASIERNIAFGMPAGAVDAGRLARAVRLAQLEPLIAALPEGYAHRVGERGIQLSGGQRQRIGIARALYRQAPVLLLDEPASALDAAAESELMEILRALGAECTIVLVSHRLRALRSCDLIYQLEHGRIGARGTYDELASHSALFRRLSGA